MRAVGVDDGYARFVLIAQLGANVVHQAVDNHIALIVGGGIGVLAVPKRLIEIPGQLLAVLLAVRQGKQAFPILIFPDQPVGHRLAAGGNLIVINAEEALRGQLGEKRQCSVGDHGRIAAGQLDLILRAAIAGLGGDVAAHAALHQVQKRRAKVRQRLPQHGGGKDG